ncbi:Lrp/AsnC family transcriptional regulator [Solihabitans fulvus]|uniref:Lrp/AsnC family transcriptional regulator n=1 Tax=Solihabitans fulvus TaxID=1892852 RepID=A0A5B2WS92_9PSEU|nr:Lrp/AsnC family transcriptional regulator [Solihabitans fulvus]KAA2253854.1 Lrp/AsnC family transcriptional regulator [Solihabitans fulvus]
MDDTDRALLALLQHDATLSYTTLAGGIGLSSAATHDRVRKLRDTGVIRRTTIDVDPTALGRPTLAYVLLSADTWIGDDDTATRLRALPWVEEAHIVAGSASLLVKVRTADNTELQAVLRRLYDIPGVSGTQTIVVLDTVFERPTNPHGNPTTHD